MRPIGLRFLVCVLLSCFTTMAIAETTATEQILLRPGYQHIIDLPHVSRISIGNPGVVEAQVLSKNGGILVVGKSAGSTDLVIWTEGTRQLRSIEVADAGLTLLEKVGHLVSGYPDVSFRDSGSIIFINGIVYGPDEKKSFDEFAKQNPGVVARIEVAKKTRPILSYELKFIELARGEAARLGVKWPDAIPIQVAVGLGGSEGKTGTITSEMSARVDLLLADGRARIVANPRLVCESGEKARFLAGGEIPIVLITPETRTVEWKNYGIILEIEPRAESSGLISSRIVAEISSIDHGSGTSEIPGFLTRKVSTFFSTRPGETILLSGLVRNESAKDISRLPLLGQIPIIGELFKSRSFRENQTELALFITPSEVQSEVSELSQWEERSIADGKATKFRLLD